MTLRRTLWKSVIVSLLTSCGGPSASSTHGRRDVVALKPHPREEGAYLVTCRDGSQESRGADAIRLGWVCFGSPRDLVGDDYEISARWAVQEGLLTLSSPEAFAPRAPLTGEVLTAALKKMARRTLGPRLADTLPRETTGSGPVARAKMARALRKFINDARSARGLITDYPPAFEDVGYEITDVSGLPEESSIHDMLAYCASTMHLYDNASARFQPTRTVTRAEGAEALHRFESCLTEDLYPGEGGAPRFDSTPDFDFPGMGVGSFFLPSEDEAPSDPRSLTFLFSGERRGLPISTLGEAMPRAAGLEKAPDLLARIVVSRDLSRESPVVLRVALALNPHARATRAQGNLLVWQPTLRALPQGKAMRVLSLSGTPIEGRAAVLEAGVNVERGRPESWRDLSRALARAGLDPAAPAWILFEDSAMPTEQRIRLKAIARMLTPGKVGYAPFSWSSFAFGFENPLPGPRRSELPGSGDTVVWNELPFPEATESGELRIVAKPPLSGVRAEIRARNILENGSEVGLQPLRLTLRSTTATQAEVMVYRLSAPLDDGTSEPPVAKSLFKGSLTANRALSIGLENAAALRMESPTAPLHTLVFVLKTSERNVVLAALHQYSSGGGGGQGSIFPF